MLSARRTGQEEPAVVAAGRRATGSRARSPTAASVATAPGPCSATVRVDNRETLRISFCERLLLTDNLVERKFEIRG